MRNYFHLCAGEDFRIRIDISAFKWAGHFLVLIRIRPVDDHIQFHVQCSFFESECCIRCSWSDLVCFVCSVFVHNSIWNIVEILGMHWHQFGHGLWFRVDSTVGREWRWLTMVKSVPSDRWFQWSNDYWLNNVFHSWRSFAVSADRIVRRKSKTAEFRHTQ